jgi:hypothetical protein
MVVALLRYLSRNVMLSPSLFGAVFSSPLSFFGESLLSLPDDHGQKFQVMGWVDGLGLPSK